MNLKLKKKHSKKMGLPPGSLVYVGDHAVLPVTAESYRYSQEKCEEQVYKSPLDFKLDKNLKDVLWVNVEGIHDKNVIAHFGNELGIHVLVLEDIMNPNQRPKVEDFGEYIYLVLHMLRFDDEKKEIVTEQVSFLLGNNWLVSFQDNIEGDVFDPVRERLKSGKGYIFQKGPDYLLYSLLDVIVDHYFECMEKIGDIIEDADEHIVMNPSTDMLSVIHRLKHNLIVLRKQIWPLREVMAYLERAESSFIADGTKKYFRDVYDHTIQIMETVETHRDMVQGMMDMYYTAVSNQQNAVMKTLTLMATIFMPLTFIVGVYGMNFDYMPELHSKWGYPAVWSVMVFLTVGMIVFFKKKKWF